MAEYWFKQRRYGYGATPTTGQGWALVLVLLAAIALLAIGAASLADGVSPLAMALLASAALAGILGSVVVTYRKTEGGWRWRWGDDR
jgi:hypothetical protein